MTELSNTPNKSVFVSPAPPRENDLRLLSRCRSVEQYLHPDFVQPELTLKDKVCFKVDGSYVLVPLAELIFLQSAGNYVEVFYGNRKLITRDTLTSLEEKLPGHRFLRVHRSAIVSLEHIQEVQTSYNGDLKLIMTNQYKVPASRNYRQKLDLFLNLS